jgi:NAD(P)-dependent dehydrogenase (short-subunit alcohol dehydrogenase family)
MTALRLEGKTALVTGAGKKGGIGEAYCRGLAAAGANVVIADVVDENDVASQVRQAGRQAAFIRTDLTQEKDILDLKEQVDAKIGPCDIVVHNAGVFPHHSIEEISIKEWRSVHAVNLDALFLLTRTFMPSMKARKWGRIIGISSTTFHAGWPPNLSHYISSKAGLIGFVRAAAREGGPFGVTVNAIAPGVVLTDACTETSKEDPTLPPDLYEALRMEQCIPKTLVPEDLVGPLLFLASNDATYVTGQTLLVDCGWQHV